jgi:hypothetical protein
MRHLPAYTRICFFETTEKKEKEVKLLKYKKEVYLFPPLPANFQLYNLKLKF